MEASEAAINAVLAMLARRRRLRLTARDLVEVLRWCQPARSMGAAMARGWLLEKHPLEVTMLFAAAADPTLPAAALWAKGLAAERLAKRAGTKQAGRDAAEARRRRGELARARRLLARATGQGRVPRRRRES